LASEKLGGSYYPGSLQLWLINLENVRQNVTETEVQSGCLELWRPVRQLGSRFLLWALRLGLEGPVWFRAKRSPKKERSVARGDRRTPETEDSIGSMRFPSRCLPTWFRFVSNLGFPRPMVPSHACRPPATTSRGSTPRRVPATNGSERPASLCLARHALLSLAAAAGRVSPPGNVQLDPGSSASFLSASEACMPLLQRPGHFVSSGQVRSFS